MNWRRHALLVSAGCGILGLAVVAPTTLGHLVTLARLPAPAPSTDVPSLSGLTNGALGDLASYLHPAPLNQRAPKISGVDAITNATGSLPPAATALAYAPEAAPGTGASNPILAIPPALLAEATGVREAIAAYRSGDLPTGDAAAATTTNDVARTAVEWAALRLAGRTSGQSVSLERLTDVLARHPDWPAAAYLRRRAEEILFTDKRKPAEVNAIFAARQPETPYGRLALARTLLAEGDTAGAGKLVAQVWRNADLTPALETALRKEFPDALARADHKARADRLFYKESAAADLRAATLAGLDVAALARVREDYSDKAAAALTPEMQKDPTLLFARIHKLRHDGKIAEAARAMQEAPRNAVLLVNADEWWVERRLIARKLLDLGDSKGAYQLCAEAAAQARDLRIEAEFHAGWIALRFLSDPALAAPHFAAAAALAETPISIARAAYWQGRTAQAAAEAIRQSAAEAVKQAAEPDEQARAFFEKAASQPTTYYGQLALARLGRTDLALRRPEMVALGDERALATRVIELYEALDLRDLAIPLALESARSLADDGQIAALSAVVTKANDARASLMVGKLASQRGFPLEEQAFPTFGIPRYEPLARSAPPALVYAIARQESSFDGQAQSGAGAKGLMQMLPSTARRTAQHAGVPFDEARLLSEPAFNAQLGAAHLGELIGEHQGSMILTFAAYNAGGKRVKEWIAAYGDPRDPKVDPVDWVERIPITETRNYVQRVAENLLIYRQRFGEDRTGSIEDILRSTTAAR